jgi:hypothetical protein
MHLQHTVGSDEECKLMTDSAATVAKGLALALHSSVLAGC